MSSVHRTPVVYITYPLTIKGYETFDVDSLVPHSTIRHNNQTSVFMVYESARKFCLLHDNRIFHLKKESGSPDINSQPSKLSVSEAIDCLNNLVTTAKYRAIYALYCLFRVIDYAVLIYFIYLLVTAGVKMERIVLYIVVALEIFYDVMESLTKLWPMERVKLFIAVAFYGLYFWQFLSLFRPIEDYTQNWYLLTIRFIAFLLELGLDIALDTEIHNDIIGFRTQKWFSITRTDDLKKIENSLPWFLLFLTF